MSKELTPWQAAIVKAVKRLGCLRYFPADGEARAEVMRLLDRMANTPKQLDWLVDTMIDQVGEWQGPAELRGIFCTRFRPKDGIERYSSHPMFSPEANEARHAMETVELKRLPEPTHDFGRKLIEGLAEKKRIQ